MLKKLPPSWYFSHPEVPEEIHCLEFCTLNSFLVTSPIPFVSQPKQLLVKTPNFAMYFFLTSRLYQDKNTFVNYYMT